MKSSDSPDAEVQAEIRWYQENSERLAKEEVPESTEWKQAPGTSTISVRMNQEDVDRLSAMAQARGVPVSHLVRPWILEHVHSPDDEGVARAMQDFDASYLRLRRAIGATD